jgi:hypothetical protein
MPSESTIKVKADTSEAQTEFKDLGTTIKKVTKETTKAVTDGNKTTEKSYKSLGIRSEKAIKESTKKARKAFDDLKRSGVASANDIKRAHEKMTAKIKSNNAEMRTSAGRVGKAFKTLLLNPVIAAGAALVATTAAIKGFFVAGLADEKAAAQLRDTVESLGVSFETVEGKIKAVQVASAEYARTQEGVVQGVITQLINRTGNLEGSLSNVNLVFDLMAAKNVTLETSIRKVGRVMEGEIGALSELFTGFEGFNKQIGNNATASQKAAIGLSFLNERIGGAKQAIGPAQEAVEIFADAWARFADFAGAILIPILPKIINFFRAIPKFVKKATAAISFFVLPIVAMSDALGITDKATKKLNERIDKLQKELVDETRALENSTLAAKRHAEASKTMSGATKDLIKEIGEVNEELAEQEKASKDAAKEAEKAAGKQIKAAKTIATEQRKATVAVGETAKAFFEAARGRAEDIGKSTGQILKEDFKEAIPLIDQAYAEMRKGTEEGFASAAILIEQAKGPIAAILETKGAVTAKLKTEANELSFDIVDLQTKIADLKAKLSEDTVSTHTTIMQTVQGRNSGGYINPVKRAIGGFIPGSGNSDTVPAMLTPGEFVLNKSASKDLGPQILHALNSLGSKALTPSMSAGAIQKFANGGEVQSRSGSGQSVNVNLDLGGRQFQMSASGETANDFVGQVRNMNVIHGRRRSKY